MDLWLKNKTVVRYHYISIEIAKITKAHNAKCWWKYGETRTLPQAASGNVVIQQSGKQFSALFLKESLKIKCVLLIWHSISIHVYLPKTSENMCPGYSKICKQMFILDLFTIAKSFQTNYGMITQWNTT